MRCFNHPDTEAAGICKVCQKGLCHGCAADLGYSIVCKGQHEAQGQAIQSLLLRSIRLQKTAGKARFVQPFFVTLIGAIFVAFGLSETSTRASRFLLYAGCGFVAFAVALFFINWRAFGAARASEDDAVKK